MHPLQRECNRLVEAGLPGAFVYRTDPEGSSEFYSAGFADLATQQFMSPDLRYPITSTTKVFIAVVTLQLFAEGKLDLRDTTAKWLPDLPIPNASSLTLEHLLRMRSGLCDFESDPCLLGTFETHRQPYTLEYLIHLGIKHPAKFLPGTRYETCNTNFCLLELILERITKQDLAREIEQRIFIPAGMAQSTYPDEGDLTIPEPYIRGYVQTSKGLEEARGVFHGRGDGGLISTATDLARFFRALLFEKTLLSENLLTRMMSIVHDQPAAKELYGLGLMASPMPFGMVWGHPGHGFGYSHLPYFHYETGRFVVFMINGLYSFRNSILIGRAIRAEAFTSGSSHNCIVD